MKFAVVDLTASLHRDDLAAYAAAQQRQLREHYAARYDGDGIDDEVRWVAKRADLLPDEFPVRLRNATGDDGALGEHGLDGADVYLDLLAKYGQPWQPCASHEVLEARADRRLHACVELDDGSIWDREVCDRVEAESYEIDGVPLSNFSTPECFEPPPGSTILTIVAAAGGHGGAYDWMGTSTRPNEVRPGGYAQRYDLGKGWSQVGEMRPYRSELAARGWSRGSKRAARRPDPLAELAATLGLIPAMLAPHPLDPSIAIGADPRRGIVYLIAVEPEGATVLRRWDAQSVEAARSLLDRARCIIESGVGDMGSAWFVGGGS